MYVCMHACMYVCIHFYLFNYSIEYSTIYSNSNLKTNIIISFEVLYTGTVSRSCDTVVEYSTILYNSKINTIQYTHARAHTHTQAPRGSHTDQRSRQEDRD